MIAYLGFGFLFIAFLVALYTLGAAGYAARTKSKAFAASARLAVLMQFVLVSLGVIALLVLMLTEQYQYTYVFRVISHDLPFGLKITALWGGQAGSLLFWIWLLAGVAAASMLWGRQKELVSDLPWVALIYAVVQFFFLFMVLFLENPFERIWLTPGGQVLSSFIQPAGTFAVYPIKGMGLNPLLRHFGMILHPPMLYLGFVTFLVPFAYATASLINRKNAESWMEATRGWILAGWIFLSGGLVLGSRWSYDVLGWGGYWGWDPVEIAALMPWLTSTALLHSLILQKRRDLFKRWNYVLALLTFCLVILGAFLTRTGVLSSVHAFSASASGPVFFVLIGLCFVVSLGLLLWRWPLLQSQGEINSALSKEALFLFNNILFICIFLICLVGVLFPILSQIFTGQQVTVGPGWYKATTGPLFALLVLLMGVVPLSAWGAGSLKRLWKTLWLPAAVSLLLPIILLITGNHSFGSLLGFWLAALAICTMSYDFARTAQARGRVQQRSILRASCELFKSNLRRYGGYLVHFGVVVMALGIIGMEFFHSQTQITLQPGQTQTFHGFSMQFNGLQAYNSSDLQQTFAQISVSRAKGQTAQLLPHVDNYVLQNQSVQMPATWNRLNGELYLVLVDWTTGLAPSATLRVFYNPLVDCLWIGAVLLILGGLLAFWPEKNLHPKTEPAA